MHIGAYDDEPETVLLMDTYLQENGYENDITEIRLHHEIYLSDPRKTEPAKCKTVIRHPIEKIIVISKINKLGDRICQIMHMAIVE